MCLTINILFNDTRLGHHLNKVLRLDWKSYDYGWWILSVDPG